MRLRTIYIAFALAGCRAAPSPSGPPVVLLGAQMQAQDEQLVGQHFRTLLDFEHDADAAFVTAAAASRADGHTGSRSLHAASPARVNVGSLLFGANLPGDWTLVGAYVRTPVGGDIAVSLLSDGTPVCHATRAVPAGVWAFVAVDLTDAACRAALPGAHDVRLQFDAPGGLDLDDVLLVDNRRMLVDTTADAGWKIEARGLATYVTAPGFSVRIAADEWLIDESGPRRLRLHDAAGRPWTLLPDGRSVHAGQMEMLAGAGADLLASHRSPADLTMDDGVAALDRETPGDADNDGYNEARAAYQIVAKAPRLTVTVRPRSAAVASPLLEIRNLPAGPVTVNVEGKLIDTAARLPDGRVLVLLPITIETPTEVTIVASGN